MAVIAGLSLGPVMIVGSFLGKRIVDRILAKAFALMIDVIVCAFDVLFRVRGKAIRSWAKMPSMKRTKRRATKPDPLSLTMNGGLSSGPCRRWGPHHAPGAARRSNRLIIALEMNRYRISRTNKTPMSARARQKNALSTIRL